MTSDKRAFTGAWKKSGTERSCNTIHLTATRAYIGGGDKIFVCDTVTMQEITEIAPRGGSACDISLSRDEKSLFVAHGDGTASVVDLDTEKEVILRGHTDAVTCIIQGEGTDVLTCSMDETIRRWNSLTGSV